ncbi:MAG TPA: phosphate signaling complex protein PhoU [Solirubrobacteraceae bacterium]|nr:phosphate signaling complex protein PhoU [Solirubrobacteraceae bacterium]
MEETRHRFHAALTELEQKTLDGFELVIEQLDKALQSVRSRDVELAATVVADDERINRRYREIHEDALSLLARQTPVAGDLRLVAALLDIGRCIERMGDQCANIAKLVPLSGSEATTETQILATIERMGELVRSQVAQAEEAFDTRDAVLARDLVRRAGDISRLDRELFNRALEAGQDLEAREWAMSMILVARCLERIAENSINIVEQTVFVVIGLFREAESESQLT